MMKEKWRPIPSIPQYAVSTHGRVKALAIWAPFIDRAGVRRIRFKEESLLSQQKQNGGYLIVNTCTRGKRKAKTVHSLVAEAFLGLRPKGLDVCHNDGTRTNNQVGNLRYDTRKNNFKDMHLHGTFGLIFTNAKLSIKAIRAIKRARGLQTAKHLAKKHKVSTSQIRRIWRGTNWSSIK
jgi:hypothetical protein